MGYTKSAIIGVSWLGAARAATRFGSLIRTAILARLLTPAQFGIFGMAALVLAFLEIMVETGVNVVLIQEKDDVKEFINTAWVISIIRGIMISILIILSTPLVILFFKTSELTGYILLISMVPFIRGFINPAIVNFQKDLKFHLEFKFRTAIFFVDATVAIIITLITMTPVGLIWGLIAGALAEVVISQLFVKPRPRFKLDSKKAKTIVGRGKWMTLAGIFNYFSSQGDDAVVGRIMDSTALGLYQVAYKISTLPLTEVTQLINKVTLPVYVRISDDKKRLRRAFVRTMIAITLIVVPISLVIYLFPNFVINILLGSKWSAAVPVLKVLAVFGVIRALIGVPHSLFLSLKKQRVVAISMLLETIGLAIFIVPMVNRYGIVGAANATILSTFLNFPYLLYKLDKEFS